METNGNEHAPSEHKCTLHMAAFLWAGAMMLSSNVLYIYIYTYIFAICFICVPLHIALIWIVAFIPLSLARLFVRMHSLEYGKAICKLASYKKKVHICMHALEMNLHQNRILWVGGLKRADNKRRNGTRHREKERGAEKKNCIKQPKWMTFTMIDINVGENVLIKCAL